jgi:hypothetical protein
MELKLWPHEKKTAYYDRTGGKGSVFTEDYVPAEDLQGYEHLIQIEPGFFLGGYAGTLEMLQMQQSGAMSMETFLEQHPYYREPEKERRRIDGDKLREAMLADLMAKGQNGQLQPGAFAAIKKAVEEDDMDLFDAIAQVDKEGGLVAMPEMGQPGMAQGLDQLLGGGGGVPGMPGPLPSLDEMRSV